MITEDMAKSVRDKEDLGYMYGGGADAMLQDIHTVNSLIRDHFPEIPLILFGHSMGSLVVRTYAKEHDRELDALIVCGSPSKNYLRPLGAAVGHAEAAVLGDSIGAIFWRQCRLVRLHRALQTRRADLPGAVRTRRWCGSMKKKNLQRSCTTNLSISDSTFLEMKKVGIFLKLIFWCNPMMNGLLRSIDMWGEIACDRYVCK